MTMDFKDIKIFSDKGKDVTLEDVFKDIYNNSKKRNKKLLDLLTDLEDSIETDRDRLLMIPLLQKYMELGAVTDDKLIKMVLAIQKFIDSKKSNTPEGEDLNIPREEIEELLKNVTNGKIIGLEGNK